jgi:hypothetical protein
MATGVVMAGTEAGMAIKPPRFDNRERLVQFHKDIEFVLRHCINRPVPRLKKGILGGRGCVATGPIS